MKVKKRMEGEVAIFTASGNIMSAKEGSVLHKKVKAASDEGVKKVIIDLKKVKWMNSSGIGVLMASWGSMAQSEGKIKLACATEKVKSLLVITQLLQFFENYDSVEEALKSFEVQ
jgi:anti-sigma B factor antagonist